MSASPSRVTPDVRSIGACPEQSIMRATGAVSALAIARQALVPPVELGHDHGGRSYGVGEIDSITPFHPGRVGKHTSCAHRQQLQCASRVEAPSTEWSDNQTTLGRAPAARNLSG